jgi:hypothetical protein
MLPRHRESEFPAPLGRSHSWASSRLARAHVGAGRLHRLNDAKREVIIYDYVGMRVPVLARMAAKRRLGYHAIGYKVLGTSDLFSGQAVTPKESA